MPHLEHRHPSTKKYLRDPEILQKNTEGFQTVGEVETVCTALLRVYRPDIHAGSPNKVVDGRFGATNCTSAAGHLHSTVQRTNIKFWNR